MEQKHVFDHYNETIEDKDLKMNPEKSWKYLQEKNKDRLNNTAMSEDDKKITYGELFENWHDTAKTLSGYDISKEDGSRVLMIMPNLIQMNFLDYAADITGAIASFVDPTIDYETLKKYIEQEKITDIISLDFIHSQNISGHEEELIKEYNINNIFVVHDKFFTSLLPKKYQALAPLLKVQNRFNKYVTRFQDAKNNSIYSQIKYDNATEEEIKKSISIINHTSGTTSGVGKPIPITDYNRNALSNNYELAKFNYVPGMTMLHFIPYFAGYGSINTTNLGLSQGLELQEIPLFNPKLFGDYLIKYRPNIVLGTSACWLGMIDNPKYANIDLSHLVYASTGGSPMSVDEEIRINYFLKTHGSTVSLTKGYGLSETGGCVITTIDGYNKIGTQGVIMPGINAKIKTEDGTIKDVSKEPISGELLLNSETLTCGKLDEKDVVKLIEIDGKQYYATGDKVSFDKVGNMEYLGRIDGMFQRYDGYNVYPLNIENVFKSYPFIKNVSVVSSYSEKDSGFIPRVVIELTKENKNLNREDIINSITNNSFLSFNHKSEYKPTFRDLPHIWDFVVEIPINTMEKNDLYTLQNDLYEKERYILDVIEDNMSVKKYSIEYIQNNERGRK